MHYYNILQHNLAIFIKYVNSPTPRPSEPYVSKIDPIEIKTPIGKSICTGTLISLSFTGRKS